MKNTTKEATYKVNGETIDIFRDGVNDYWVYFHDTDDSVRGTLKDVWEEIDRRYIIEFLEEV